MNRFKLLNLFLPALLAITSTAVAQPVMYVDVANTSPGSGNSWGACKNDLANAIQTAFTAGTYTEIRVAKGTYKPGTTRASTFFMLSNVSIKGGYPGYTTGTPDVRNIVANPTILSGDIQTLNDPTDNCYHVVTAKTPSGGSVNDTAIVDGFTIRDGYGDSSVDSGNGAGVYVPFGSRPRITSCTVTVNYAPGSGGGIWINGDSSINPDVLITNTVVVENEADFAGGGLYGTDASPLVLDSSFDENTAGYVGGGIALDAVSSAEFRRCTFDSNLIPYGTGGANGGGGVYTSANGWLDPEADPPIPNPGPIFRECSISENTAHAGAGGGTFADHSEVSFVRCRIASNTLTNPDISDLYGGGLYFGGGNGRVIECIIAHNVIEDEEGYKGYGGGIFILKGGFDKIVNSTIVFNSAGQGGGLYGFVFGSLIAQFSVFNSTFAENYSAGTGGGAYVPIVGSPPNASFTNCIFWENQAASAASIAEAQLYVPGVGTNTVTHSCIQDAAENDSNVPYNGSGTNIDLDPNFRNIAATPDGNFRLSYCSPAIDAGNSPVVPADSLDGDQDTDLTEKTPDLNILRRVVDAPHRVNSVVSIPLTSTTLVVDLGAYEFPLLGDLNDDEKVNGLDIQPFTHCMIQVAGGVPTGHCIRADMNDDGVLNFDDVTCFIAVLLDQPGCLTCEGGGGGAPLDCNENEVADAIDIREGDSEDCNGNGIPDECDIADETSNDANSNGIPDECETDCNANGIPDDWDISEETSNDVNSNDIPDECEPDCNSNDVPDAWDISTSTSDDCNENGVPDECDEDCNGNDIPDDCDIADSTSEDCNENGIPDECDLSRSILPSFDCNDNDVPDECDIANATSLDTNENGIPDECEEESLMGGGGGESMMSGGGEGGGEFDEAAAWELFFEWYDEVVLGEGSEWGSLSGSERFHLIMDELQLLGLPYAAPW